MDTYTLTETHHRPDGQLTALFEVTRAGGQGRYFERITAADLPAIFARLGVEPPGELLPEPVEESDPVTDLATLAASAS